MRTSHDLFPQVAASDILEIQYVLSECSLAQYPNQISISICSKLPDLTCICNSDARFIRAHARITPNFAVSSRASIHLTFPLFFSKASVTYFRCSNTFHGRCLSTTIAKIAKALPFIPACSLNLDPLLVFPLSDFKLAFDCPQVLYSSLRRVCSDTMSMTISLCNASVEYKSIYEICKSYST